MFSQMRCPLVEELDEWVFVCQACKEAKVTFLNGHPDVAVPDSLADLVEELRVESELDIGGLPDKEGIVFRVLGGRWIPKAQFLNFAGNPEYEEEFGTIDTAEEDRSLPLVRGQAEFAQIFRDLSRGLFERMQRSGRTVVQNSDWGCFSVPSTEKILIDQREVGSEIDNDSPR
jgi:hypothetical protein